MNLITGIWKLRERIFFARGRGGGGGAILEVTSLRVRDEISLKNKIVQKPLTPQVKIFTSLIWFWSLYFGIFGAKICARRVGGPLLFRKCISSPEAGRSSLANNSRNACFTSASSRADLRRAKKPRRAVCEEEKIWNHTSYLFGLHTTVQIFIAIQHEKAPRLCIKCNGVFVYI